MKLHLPKQLFTALLAAITSYTLATGAAYGALTTTNYDASGNVIPADDTTTGVAKTVDQYDGASNEKIDIRRDVDKIIFNMDANGNSNWFQLANKSPLFEGEVQIGADGEDAKGLVITAASNDVQPTFSGKVTGSGKIYYTSTDGARVKFTFSGDVTEYEGNMELDTRGGDFTLAFGNGGAVATTVTSTAGVAGTGDISFLTDKNTLTFNYNTDTPAYVTNAISAGEGGVSKVTVTNGNMVFTKENQIDILTLTAGSATFNSNVTLGSVSGAGSLSFGANARVSLSSSIGSTGTVSFAEGATIDYVGDISNFVTTYAHDGYGYGSAVNMDLLAAVTANREVTVSIYGQGSYTMSTDGTVSGATDTTGSYYIAGDVSSSTILSSGDDLTTMSNLVVKSGTLTVDSAWTVPALQGTAGTIQLTNNLTLTGDSTLTGTILQGAGELIIGADATLTVNSTARNIESNIRVGSGATLEFLGTGADAIEYDQTGRTIYVNGGKIDVGTTRQTVGNWTFDLTGATIQGAGQSTGANVGLDFHQSSTINVHGAEGATTENPTISTIDTKVRIASGYTLTYDVDANARLNQSGALVINGTITKDGAGTLYLSASNSESGAINVEEGTLMVNAIAALASSTVTVQDGAVLDLTEVYGDHLELAEWEAIENNTKLVTQEGGFIKVRTDHDGASGGELNLDADGIKLTKNYLTSRVDVHAGGKTDGRALTIGSGATLMSTDEIKMVSNGKLVVDGGNLIAEYLTMGHIAASIHPGYLEMSSGSIKTGYIKLINDNANTISISGGALEFTTSSAIVRNTNNSTTISIGGTAEAPVTLKATQVAWTLDGTGLTKAPTIGNVTIDGANTQSITFNGATLTGAITNNASLILGEDVVWNEGATVSNAGTLQINKGTGDLVLNDQLCKNYGAYKPSAVTNSVAGNLVLANTGNKTLSGDITISNGGKVTLQGGTFGTADAAITYSIQAENTTTLVLDGVTSYISGDRLIAVNLLLKDSTLHLGSGDVLDYNYSNGTTVTTVGQNSRLDVGANRQSLRNASLSLTGGVIYGAGDLYSWGDNIFTAGLDFYDAGTIDASSGSSIIATGIAARDSGETLTFKVGANATLTIGAYTVDGVEYRGSLVGKGSFSKTESGTLIYKGAAFTNTLDVKAGVFEYYVEDERTHMGSITDSGTTSGDTTTYNGIFKKSGSGTLTLDSANTSVTTLNVAGGKLVYNSSTETTHTLSSNAGTTFEKTGSSTLTADINNLKGELLISAGTLKLKENATATTSDSQVPWRSVTVGKDAVFDINGKPAYNNLTLESGSTLSNSTANTDPGAGERQLPTITLTGAATMNATGHIRMLGSGHDVTALYLGGHTLTKTGTGTFFMQNTHVKTGGTIQINAGLVKAYTHNSKTQDLNGLNLHLNGGNFELAGSSPSSQSIQNLTLTSGTLTIGSGLTLTTMGDTTMSGGTVSGNLCLSGTITLNGSVNMSGATLSGTSLGGFTLLASAKPANSGLNSLTYQLWSGDGSVNSSQSTISVGGVNYEMNAATGTFTTAGTVYYVATGNTITVGGDSAAEGTASATSFVVDGTLSVAADTSTQSINGSAGTVNVAESITLTLTGMGSSIGTLSATNGTVALAAGSSLYLGQTGTDAQETTSSIGTVNVAGASTIHLNEKATLSAISKTGNGSITLNGSGVYEAGAVNTLSSGLSLGAGWAGTVVVSGTHSADIKLNTLGRAGSTVEIAEAGISGYFENADTTFNPNLKLTGNLKLSNGYSNADYVFAGTVSGDGSLEIARTGGAQNSFTFTNSIAGWEGTLLHSSSQTDTVIFAGAADTINATINRTGGTLDITVNNEATFNKSVTASSITVNNEATFKSAVTSEALTGSGSVVLNGSEAAYTITGTSDKVIAPEVTLAKGASLKLATSGAGYTTSLGKLYIDGTGNICSDQVSAGWQTQLTIGELYSLSAGAVLNLSSSANTTQRAIVNLNGGDFNGTINVSGSSKTTGRKYALNINDGSAAADAVILLNGTQSSNKVALGIGANEVSVKGIKNQDNATGTMLIVSGQQAFGTDAEFGSDTTFRTLVIDTDGTDNTVSEDSATSATLGSYLNLEKQGVGSQTFSGNVGDFNGALNVQGGTLAFTGSGNMTATGVSVADGANLTLGGTVGLILAGGTAEVPATYSMGSLISAGNTITVSEHAALSTLSHLSGTVTLAGSGLYELQDGAITMTSGVSLSTSWTGTVRISNVAYDGSTVNNNKMETMASTAGSGKLMLTNVNGWLGTATMSNHLILENGTGGEAALYLSNGSSGNNETKTAKFSGGISGTGDIQFNWNKSGVSNCTIAHEISGDTASWSGKFISNESGSLDVQVDFTKGGEVFSSTVDGGGVENRTDNKLLVNIGSSESDTSFNGSIGKTPGAGAVELNVTHNNVTFNKEVNVDKLSVAQGASAQLGNTMTVGGVSFSASESATAESPAKLLANGSSALAQLQADASFTIQDMTLSNVKLSAVEGASVALNNVSATNTLLAGGGDFTLNATPTVEVAANDTTTGRISYTCGLGVESGSSFTLNLDVINAVRPDQHGTYDLSITLSGFGSDFRITSEEAILGMVKFDASSWLAQALEEQGAEWRAEITASTENTVVTQSSVPTVTYSAGTGENVGTLVITINGLNVPEPTTATLSLLALAALAARRRRK